MRRDIVAAGITFSGANGKENLISISRDMLAHNAGAGAVVVLFAQAGGLVQPQLEMGKCVMLKDLFAVDPIDIIEDGGQGKRRRGIV